MTPEEHSNHIETKWRDSEHWALVGIDTSGEPPGPSYGPVWLEITASNYLGYNLEEFETLGVAVGEMVDRDRPSATYYPCWSDGFHAYIYGADPTEVDGAYPIAELYPVWNEDTNETVWTLSEGY